MAVALKVTARPPFRNILGQFTEATEELKESKRSMMRHLGRRYVAIARDEAPKGKTGKFARGIRFRTFVSGDRVGFKATTPQPLGKFIIEGTKPHPIAARNAGALVFPWPKVGMLTIVPKGGGFKTHVRNGALFVGKGYVSHPGTKPNPFMDRALNRWLPEAEVELNRIARDWATDFTS